MKNAGFTLLETLITLSILMILASSVLSSYSHNLANQRLENAANQIYTDLKIAKSEAMKQSKNIFVSFQRKDDTWCYGINENTQCDCNKKNNCTLNSIENVTFGDEFEGITLQKARFAGGGSSTAFDPKRGFAIGKGVKNGTIWLQSKNNSQIAIIINRIGRVRFCSKDLAGYSTKCPKPP